MISTPPRADACPVTLSQARQLTRVGVLAALALVLSYVETFIPLPVPFAGVKLGLANIIVLVALVMLDAKSALAVALIKVLAAGLLFGSPLMMAYSAAGTLLAFCSMALCIRARSIHLVMVAIVGAVFHNIGQLFVAQLLFGTALVWYSAPILLVAACATGALTGAASVYTLAVLGIKR